MIFALKEVIKPNQCKIYWSNEPIWFKFSSKVIIVILSSSTWECVCIYICAHTHIAHTNGHYDYLSLTKLVSKKCRNKRLVK